MSEGETVDARKKLTEVEAALAGKEALRASLPADVVARLVADLEAQRETLLAAVASETALTVASESAAAADFGTATEHPGGPPAAPLAGSATALGAGAAAASTGGIAAGGNITIHHSPPNLGPSPASIRDNYLRSVVREAGLLDLAGIDPVASQGRDSTLRLQALYTALLTLSPEEREEPGMAGGEPLQPERSQRRASAMAQLNRQARLVLLGEPGSGKSTFVNFVAISLAGALLQDPEVNLTLLTQPLPSDDGELVEEPQPWDHGPLFPVRVVLRDFAARGLPPPGERAGAEHLWQFVENELRRSGLADAFPLLQKELREGRGLLLLDGLDEVPEAEQRRQQLRQAVEDFARCIGESRVLLTSRTYAYQNQEWRIGGFAEAVLAPFSRGQIHRFVTLWYQQMVAQRRVREDSALGLAELLRRGIFGSDRILGLAERPLLLTLIAGLHASKGGTLPERRGDLYEQAVELLLHTWEMRRWDKDAQGRPVLVAASLAEWLKVDREEVRQALDAVAFEAHSAQTGSRKTADVREGDLVGRLLHLSRSPVPPDPRELVAYLRDRAGLLVERGEGVYTFPHRTFQEYLAACHLTARNYPKAAAKLGREDPGRWREVVLLAGAKAKRGAAASVWGLADSLCYREPGVAGAEAGDEWGALLAGQTLAESADLGSVDPEDRPKLERVWRWLLALLRRERFPARERAAAGKALALLGDPRFEPRRWSLLGDPLAGFIPIPAGPFLMGSTKDDPLAHERERPQHEVDLPAFWISRFPVTVAQFRAFVAASGHTPVERDCLEGVANAPVVLVTWYEALAYARWLGARLAELASEEERRSELWDALRSGNVKASLPSEAEWEKAARGLNGRTFPWGDEADPNRANYYDTGLLEPSAVGAFPGGESVFGCEEMSGNVWEWTRSLWGEDGEEPQFGYPYKKGDSREDLEASPQALRVVRGGAFLYTSMLVRCAARSGFGPGFRSGDLGFRVVLSPFPL